MKVQCKNKHLHNVFQLIHNLHQCKSLGPIQKMQMQFHQDRKILFLHPQKKHDKISHKENDHLNQWMFYLHSNYSLCFVDVTT